MVSQAVLFAYFDISGTFAYFDISGTFAYFDISGTFAYFDISGSFAYFDISGSFAYFDISGSFAYFDISGSFAYFDIQAVLHGVEWSGSAAAGGVPAGLLHPNDRHRAMDLSVRRPQDPQGVPCDRLHQTHPGRGCLPPQQQQILS